MPLSASQETLYHQFIQQQAPQRIAREVTCYISGNCDMKQIRYPAACFIHAAQRMYTYLVPGILVAKKHALEKETNASIASFTDYTFDQLIWSEEEFAIELDWLLSQFQKAFTKPEQRTWKSFKTWVLEEVELWWLKAEMHDWITKVVNPKTTERQSDPDVQFTPNVSLFFIEKYMPLLATIAYPDKTNVTSTDLEKLFHGLTIYHNRKLYHYDDDKISKNKNLQLLTTFVNEHIPTIKERLHEHEYGITLLGVPAQEIVDQLSAPAADNFLE